MSSSNGVLATLAGIAIFPAIVITMTAYLVFSAVQGQSGLIRRFQIEAQEKRLAEEHAELVRMREIYTNKTRRLSGDLVDLELLDERARLVLGLGRADEIVIR